MTVIDAVRHRSVTDRAAEEGLAHDRDPVAFSVGSEHQVQVVMDGSHPKPNRSEGIVEELPAEQGKGDRSVRLQPQGAGDAGVLVLKVVQVDPPSWGVGRIIGVTKIEGDQVGEFGGRYGVAQHRQGVGFQQVVVVQEEQVVASSDPDPDVSAVPWC